MPGAFADVARVSLALRAIVRECLACFCKRCRNRTPDPSASARTIPVPAGHTGSEAGRVGPVQRWTRGLSRFHSEGPPVEIEVDRAAVLFTQLAPAVLRR